MIYINDFNYVNEKKHRKNETCTDKKQNIKVYCYQLITK